MSNALTQAIQQLTPVIKDATQGAMRTGAMGINSPQKIADEVSAVVVNQLNQEPWYQSTVTIGSLIAVIGGGYGFGYDIAVNGFPEPAAFTTSITPIIGGLIALYGRWVQRKPLGM